MYIYIKYCELNIRLTKISEETLCFLLIPINLFSFSVDVIVRVHKNFLY